jgi:hypothetical protein
MKSKHDKINLIESARCSLCNQKFPEGCGAGIHLRQTHNIGTNDPYPHSPTPVMSFTDPTDRRNSKYYSTIFMLEFSFGICYI